VIYEGWRAERWETPFSDVRSLAVVGVVDDGSLRITVEDTRSTPRRRWRIDFGRAPAYLNLLEEYRLELWQRIHTGEIAYGWTRIIPDSPWLARLGEAEALLRIHYPELTHHQIGSEDDIIDVLAPEPPGITEIEPASPGADRAGKSRTLMYPDDGAEVEQLIQHVRAASGIQERSNADGNPTNMISAFLRWWRMRFRAFILYLTVVLTFMLSGVPVTRAQTPTADSVAASALVQAATEQLGLGTPAGADSALVLLGLAADLGPSFEPALDALAHAHWLRTDRYDLDPGGYDTALTYAERVRELNPGRGWYLMGRIYGLKGEHAFALHALERALDADAENTLAALHLGYRFFDLGQHDLGIPLQARVAEAEPENRAVRNLLGFSHFHIGRFDLAAQHFEESMALRRTAFSAGGLLVTRLARGDYEGAIAFADSIRHLEPEAAYARAALGEAHFFADNNAEALHAFEQAMARDSLSTNIYTWKATALPLAQLYAAAGRTAEAARMREISYGHSDRMMRRGQEPWNVYYHYSALALQEGSRERALRWLRAAHATGMPGPVLIERDPLFALLRDDAEFREIVGRLRWREHEIQRRLGLAD
jgi:tetratricopeptide (TPR) repeat protein